MDRAADRIAAQAATGAARDGAGRVAGSDDGRTTHPGAEDLLPVHVRLADRPMGILQSLHRARTNLLGIIPEAATRQPILSGRTGKRWHMIMDPSALRRVLLERVADYPKSDVTKNLLRPAIGESLFVAEGAHWRWQRRAAAPVFGPRNIRALAPAMSGAADRAAARLAEKVAMSEGVCETDLHAEMITTTFEVVSDVTLSGERGLARDAVHAAIESYLAEAARISLFDILGLPDWVPRPGRMFAGRSLARTKAMADRVIAARSTRGPSTPPDLLDLLLAAVDPQSGRQMDAGELRDNLLTFIVAGHETTALTLSWALYLLAFDPAAQERARDEVTGTLSGPVATAEDVDNLAFVQQVVHEALRLYPPAALLSRTARVADELCGRRIEPGDTVIIPVYALHRHKALWEEPDAFRPGRFADRRAIDRYAFLPFGDGPRICIGASFALQEAVIVLATLLRRFRFRLLPGVVPKPVMILTLRPEGGVRLAVEPL